MKSLRTKNPAKSPKGGSRGKLRTYITMRVEIYTIPTCAYCKMTKELLEKNSISYIEHDVNKDMAAREEMVTKSHQRGVPVIDIDDEIFVGFNRVELEKTLGIR